MQKLILEENTFIIPDIDDYILYAPLKGTILKVNSEAVSVIRKIKKNERISDKDKQFVDQLVELGILSSNKKTKIKRKSGKYSPVSTSFLPGFDCNLRCVYCYAEGGENVSSMEFPVAKRAIDFIILNAKTTRRQKVALNFHGGGEPLLSKNMDLIKGSVEYFNKQASKNNLNGRISAATNGVLRENNLEWVMDNFDKINVSLDGPKDIQNRQRPRKDGYPSFNYVLGTIQALEQRNFPYGIRATITDESVSRMPEIIDFFHSISSKKSFHLEPLFECGRCKTTNTRSPNPEDFIRYAIEAKEKAEQLGINIHYSGAKLERVSDYFCKAAGRNFFITPDGNVTTCLEVSREDDELADIFFIGRFNPKTQRFDFNSKKIKTLMQRSVQSIPYCQDCFAKYNCAGDCLAKTYKQSGSLIDPSQNQRCVINQELLFYDIQKSLDSKSKSL